MLSSTTQGLRRTLATALAMVLTCGGLLGLGLGQQSAEAAGATRSYLVNARTPKQTAAAQAAAIRAGGKVVQSWPQIGVIVVRSSKPNYIAGLNRLRSSAVLSAADARMEPAREGAVLGRPVKVAATKRTVTAAATAQNTGRTDPMAKRQAHLGVVRATAAQQLTLGSRSVVVGVLDTGVDDRHPDLAANFSRADSVDCTAGGRPNGAVGAWRGNDSHGTHVAGTIAAARNGYGVTGIAPNVKVASVKVVNSAGESFPEYLVCGFMWAGTRQLAVTNTSLNLFDLWCGELGIGGPALTSVTRAINYASGRGVVNVSSAGNAGMDVSWQRAERCHDPLAENPSVVHVASVTNKGRLSAFSSYGRRMVDIAAPGENVLSDATGRRFEKRTGTSQAAPQVAGTLALMKSRKPSASRATLVATLRKTTRAVPLHTVGSDCRGTSRNNTCTGSGQLDTYAAVKAIR
ncbi:MULTISPECIES: S8 family serine peptidase [unclassified Luteococcus]|uniref:S8 family serine peptidase n=1 Tax=unclassified Luteococcus TaxID=2639923 RepID=UPI00313EBCB1